VKELVEKGADIDAEDAYGSLVAHKKVMWVKQRTIISIINHPFGNGKHTAYKHGDDWGIV
jgi:hypothetical protein